MMRWQWSNFANTYWALRTSRLILKLETSEEMNLPGATRRFTDSIYRCQVQRASGQSILDSLALANDFRPENTRVDNTRSLQDFFEEAVRFFHSREPIDVHKFPAEVKLEDIAKPPFSEIDR
jgi:hypothetical protein